ncbi:MAG: hypothetical protein HOP17_10115 [Acidobacteria bacterium]|nr:hypothetical protein [Acidobacteriota bacterium]
MKKIFALITFVSACIVGTAAVPAQLTIKLPGLPTVDKKKKTDGPTTRTTNDGKDETRSGDNIYKTSRPTATPVLLKNSVYVQAKTHNEYWKMKGQNNYSSWVPLIKFNHFYNNDKSLNYTVDYFNPDGSPWYSEKLEQGNLAADRTVRFESPSPYNGVLDTKSTAAIGVFAFKITDDDTKQVLYQGKFKVGKFSTESGRPEKNKFDFFVEHDWLLPFGMIGFHHSDIEIGGIMPEVSVWLKGMVSVEELEGRLFYKGQQIASTKDGAESGVSDYDERTTQFAPPFAPQNMWKRWQFQWNNFRFDNNGGFNHDYYPKALYADKNPGEYTVKIFRNGAQIRELSFTVAADGRFAVPAYTDQIFMPYQRIILPVKVIGAEKWDSAAWKTDAFYGNPLKGFALQ